MADTNEPPRRTVLFRPGRYTVDADVGFFTQAGSGLTRGAATRPGAIRLTLVRCP